MRHNDPAQESFIIQIKQIDSARTFSLLCNKPVTEISLPSAQALLTLPGICIPSVMTIPVTVLPGPPADVRARMTNRAVSAFFIKKNGLVHSAGFWLIS